MSRKHREPLHKAPDTHIHPSAPYEAEGSRLTRGGTTADSVGGPDRDKLVDLHVRIPKSLRKTVRAEAARRGITVDELVSQSLRDRDVR